MDRAGERKGGLNKMPGDIEITIQRSNHRNGKESNKTVFMVRHYEGMTLHNALAEIYRRLDASLAFRPFSCNKGTCMSCLVSVNGKTQQACTTLLRPGDRLLVEPEAVHQLVRDLVTIPSEKNRPI